jgi:hypothetical protein
MMNTVGAALSGDLVPTATTTTKGGDDPYHQRPTRKLAATSARHRRSSIVVPETRSIAEFFSEVEHVDPHSQLEVAAKWRR